MPEQPGVGFVVVTHLSPSRESRLPQIIAHYTAMPVIVAADAMTVERDHVYVAPANAVLGIDGGQLRLQRMGPGQRERKPIDLFFSALAADLGELAVGIVLSGGDGDGTLGTKAIKEHGGLTFAQVGDGFGPQHPDMPNSAISIGMVDYALPAEEMGARIAEFARSQNLLDGMAGPDDRTREPGTLETARQEIYGILRNQIGHDFGGYKTQTFFRRVQRRMQITQAGTVDGYLEMLRRDPQEVAALFRDLLISVTNFFRDAAAFDSLAAGIIPKLFEGRGAAETVRVWVPGCATGEEVFSIAHADARAHGDADHGAAGADLRHRHRRAGAERRPRRPLSRPGAGQRDAMRGGSASSSRTAAATSSPRRCATSASSPRTTSSAIRPSPASTSSPAATC